METMAKKDTQEAAMSRLFGNRESASQGQEDPQSDSDTDQEALSVDNPASRDEAQSEEESVAGAKGGSLEEDSELRSQRRTEGEGREPADSGEETGYVGDGRYRRASGKEKVRITPYVRPDQARALKVAAATGDDPRGSDMSEIVQALLDEGGYSD